MFNKKLTLHDLSQLKIVRLIFILMVMVLGFAFGARLAAAASTEVPAEKWQDPIGQSPGCTGGAPDGRCDSIERARGSCPEDCKGGDGGGNEGGGAPCNNDGVCDADRGEATWNCGDCPSVCGDDICAAPEVDDCLEDCPPEVTCGDGICSAFENADICPDDCEETPPPPRPVSPTATFTPTPEEPECGDGVCEEDEDDVTCPEDCPPETEEPTIEPTPKRESDIPEPTPTAQTMYAMDEGSEGDECSFTLPFTDVVVECQSFSFLGVTIVCCAVGGVVTGGAIYAAGKGGAFTPFGWGGSTPWGQGSGAPLPDSAMSGMLPPDTGPPGAPTSEAPPPDAPAPDASAPDAASPDAAGPDASAPDAASPDASAPDASAADAPAPDAAGPDASAADAPASDASALDASAADAPASDVSTPDAQLSELGTPDEVSLPGDQDLSARGPGFIPLVGRDEDDEDDDEE